MNADSLRAIREGRGQTQIEFAVKNDIGLTAVQTIENKWKGRKTFSSRTIRKLAEAYGVSVEEINAACGLPARDPSPQKTTAGAA